MTYQVYKYNVGKLTKEVRAKFKFFGMQLQYEEEQELLRQSGIDAWATRAKILNDGDTVGLLYDKLQAEKEKVRLRDISIRELKKELKVYRDKEPWQVGGY